LTCIDTELSIVYIDTEFKKYNKIITNQILFVVLSISDVTLFIIYVKLVNTAMNLLTLSALVHDKDSSVRFLQQRGVIHNQRFCTNNHPMVLTFGYRQDRWRCRLRQCREDIPVRQGTWLQGSRLSYRQIVLFVYCWAKELSSIKFCDNELQIGERSTIDWNNYLREVCAFVLLTNPVVIGGPGTHVEIDESLFTQRKNNVGAILPQQWVFGGICRETKECFMYTVPDRSAPTLLPIIAQSVLPGTTILSDQWRAYNGIAAMGYTHNTVNHSMNFVDPATGAHTQHIERSWKAAKERNKRHNGTHRTMIDSYMCEYMWRVRQKVNGNDIFDSILRDIVLFWPPQ
jgi:transposase-like protein